MMKLRNGLLFLLFLITTLGCSHLHKNNNVIFQKGVASQLFDGNYNGNISLKEIKKYGNFGLGTFDALDGEMVVLNNKFYQVKTDGIVYLVDDQEKIPFVNLTFFKPQKKLKINKNLDFKKLKEYLTKNFQDPNIFLAIKVTGVFSYVKARSVPRQKKPYKKLLEVIKEQTIFEYYNTKGTLVGFRIPKLMQNVAISGYHFHFISSDEKAGGHLLDFKVENIEIEIAKTNRFFMKL